MQNFQKFFSARALWALIVTIGAVMSGALTQHVPQESRASHAGGAHHVSARTTAHVAHVIDGDTVQLSDGRLVRYIGIDTPETGKGYAQTQECYAREATARNRALVAGKDVLLERDVSDTDRYGRLLRYVYVGDTFVNAVLVRDGFARARRYPPDTAHADEFAALQERARTQGKGLWGQCARN